MATIDVEFCLLDSVSFETGGYALCQKLEYLYQQNKKIYVNTANAAMAQWLDDQLWTFRDISFVPHAQINEKTSTAPIQIGYSDTLINQYDVLVNLAPSIPAYFAKFVNIIEVIPESEDLKAAGREKYKIYRNHGCQLKTSKLEKIV